jgi:LPS-assembly protein
VNPKDFAPPVTRLLVFLATAFLAAAATAVAQPRLRADTVEANDKERTARASGGAELRDADFLLSADEIVYSYADGRATATGRVVLTRGASRILADRLVYSIRDGSFTADRVRLGQPPAFVEAASATGTRKEAVLRQARITYGEPAPWQPTWTADTLVYQSDGRIRSEGSRIGVGHLQPVPLPHFQHNLKQSLDATVSVTGGLRRSLGLFIDAIALAPVADGIQAGAEAGIFTNRGLMVGPALRYAREDETASVTGSLRTGAIRDHGERGVDLLGRPVSATRAYAEWLHTQTLASGLDLNAQVNWWRDSEVIRDFRPRDFFAVQTPDSFLEAVQSGNGWYFSVFSRLQPNSFHRVQERLPELRFDLMPSALGGGVYQRGEASFALLREDPLTSGPLAPATGKSLRSRRLDAYYGIERPLTAGDWFAFTPVAGGRFTHYASTQGAATNGGTTRVLGEVGFDAAVRSSGTFAYRNDAWRIDGLRHLLTPRLSYRDIPAIDQGRARIPAIDREAFATYLQPLGLGDRRNLDELQPTHTLRLGLDNILQARDRSGAVRDLVILNLANDFRLRRRAGERTTSETHAELSVAPAPWLQVDVYQSVDPRSLALREFNSGLTLRNGRDWSVRFANNFLRREIEDYMIEGRRRLNEAYEAIGRLHYDARRRRFNEQSYGVAQNLGNTWLVSYTVSLYSGRRRESSFGFGVQVDTVRF